MAWNKKANSRRFDDNSRSGWKILKNDDILNLSKLQQDKNKKGVFVMNTKMMSQFSVMDNEELEIVSGGRGNLGSAIGGCIGAATLICVGSGIMSSL